MQGCCHAIHRWDFPRLKNAAYNNSCTSSRKELTKKNKRINQRSTFRLQDLLEKQITRNIARCLATLQYTLLPSKHMPVRRQKHADLDRDTSTQKKFYETAVPHDSTISSEHILANPNVTSCSLFRRWSCPSTAKPSRIRVQIEIRFPSV